MGVNGGGDGEGCGLNRMVVHADDVATEGSMVRSVYTVVKS